ncbi:3-ketoacyl-CoA thiolase, mitochondrial-like isoform X2 [Leptidea sinapis]|uniref:3-ketoacyl-CoA thiolase, mitochondrial-like isoform X2 n=1 Tax=Leptidea sinapis TaxID=189913 RepID=UPI00213C850C|nr:3-ketoacyl-CoA thiolase, mitochondrial-like isoform X2 [Leptidea sinapis]
MAILNKGLFIVSAKRTPFCKYGGPLRELPASHAFAAAAKATFQSANVNPSLVDCTIVGNVHFEILSGSSNTCLTGGTEIMSSLPMLARNVRFGTSLSIPYVLEDYITKEFQDSYTEVSLQQMSENLARKFNISRNDADDFAAKSHLKFISGQERGVFDPELTSIDVTLKKRELTISKDDLPDASISVEKLSSISPILESGCILTAGNTAVPADGAAALLVASEEVVTKNNLNPLARITGWSCIGVNPQEPGLGSVASVENLMNITKCRLADIDSFEINEIFSSEALVTAKALKIDEQRVNQYGGAIALGNPVAATGARMAVHIVHQIRSNKYQKAVAVSSTGGGQGVAVMFEKV